MRLSGPILDRIDIHFNMPETDISTTNLLVRLSQTGKPRRTETLVNRVRHARDMAQARNLRFGKSPFNKDIAAKHLVAVSGLSEQKFASILDEHSKSHSSARAIVKALKVARTLADLEQSHMIQDHHIREAMSWQSDLIK